MLFGQTEPFPPTLLLQLRQAIFWFPFLKLWTPIMLAGQAPPAPFEAPQSSAEFHACLRGLAQFKHVKRQLKSYFLMTSTNGKCRSMLLTISL